MRIRQCAVVLIVAAAAGCGANRGALGEPRSLTSEQAAAVDGGVRSFARDVAQDITQNGPTAWRKHFADTPAFFMAADGHLVFPSSAAATTGIQNLPQMIKQIELRWGDDLRVDPLTADLAVLATSYREVLTSPEGKRTDSAGFFTGVAELRDGRWEFRDAHWSDAVQSPPAP